jgi:tyrosyl-tRNA synthetase
VGIAELTKNAVDVLPADGLAEKLKLGRPLRVKLGIDVTSPDIHIGRAIPLQRMRAFQDEGHTGVLIIGDYTTRIGDPSGRSAERPILSDEEIDANARTYLDQAMIILDPDKRMKAQEPISISELLYPLMQAYDSVAIEADVELGGTDQLYNLLAGREVMPHYGLEPQIVLTTPLLLSWDGAKMSSSVGNNIPLTAAPEEMFGRTMRISDDQLAQWYELILEQQAPGGDPLEAKLALARFLVVRSHGDDAAQAAEEHFSRVVRRGEAPEDVPELALDGDDPVHLPKLIADGGLAASTSEARRLIGQGAVKLNGEAVSELDLPRAALAGALLQVGKRRFARLTL